jgi:hypothetical protein
VEAQLLNTRQKSVFSSTCRPLHLKEIISGAHSLEGSKCPIDDFHVTLRMYLISEEITRRQTSEYRLLFALIRKLISSLCGIE